MIDLPISADTIRARYERAAKLMQGIYSKKLVCNSTVFPIWIEESDCFWYEREANNEQVDSNLFGKEYRLVDAEFSTNCVAFDHEALAAALSKAIGQDVDARDLPITKVEMVLAPKNASTRTVSEVHFFAYDKKWLFNADNGECISVNSVAENECISPDGLRVVFLRDFNLWIRELDTGVERALTHDGEEFYVYGATGAAWGFEQDMNQHPQAIWSPDSKLIFTVQRDTRQVLMLPVVDHIPDNGNVRPDVKFTKIAYPGDEHVDTLRLLAIDCNSSLIQEVNYRKIPITRNSFGFFFSNLGWWGNDSRLAYFIDVERDYKTVRIVEFDTFTGNARILFEETSKTRINLMLNADEYPVFCPLPDSDELLWFSERSGWAHLYLYDLKSGDLKNIVTQGEWVVRDVVHIDTQRREVFLQTAGRETSRDPYYRDLCRVCLDTGEIHTLISSDHEYCVVTQKNMNTFLAISLGKDVGLASGVSPTGNFATVTRSRADETPVTVLINRDGKKILDIETTDISNLLSDWQWPETVRLVADDDLTDLFGLVYRPSFFSPDESYPIVAHVFSTPDFPFTPKGAFTNGPLFGAAYLDAAALAELGFIVIQVDTRGSSYRSKAFQDVSYGWAEAACNLEDYISCIKQLSAHYPYMDINRVGITSHCTGGPGGLQGLLQHPDFFKVGVNGIHHDSRLMSASMWGELLEGLHGPERDGLYPEELVERLQGKLLMTHGMLDACCAPAGVFRVIDALHKANKDFDMLLLPRLGHEFSSYLTRRSWDYLVVHLLELDPPKEFKLVTELDTALEAAFELR